MIILFWGIGLLASTWLFQLAWWRIRLPHNHTKGLLIVFFTLPWLTGSLSLAAGLPAPASPLEWLHIISFYVPCALTYIIAYSAIEYESPTCRMVRIIHRAGSQGIAHEVLVATMMPEKIIETRLNSLRTTGGTMHQEGCYHLLPKGKRMAKLFTLVARMFAIKRHGG